MTARCQYTHPQNLLSTFIPFADNGWIDKRSITYSPIKIAGHSIPTITILTGISIGVLVSSATTVEAFIYTAAACAALAVILNIAEFGYSRSRLTKLAIAECKTKPHPRYHVIDHIVGHRPFSCQNGRFNALFHSLSGANERRIVLNKRTIHDESMLDICNSFDIFLALLMSGADPTFHVEGKHTDLEKAISRSDYEKLSQYLAFFPIPSDQVFSLIVRCRDAEVLDLLCKKLRFNPDSTDAAGKTVMEHWLPLVTVPIECYQYLLAKGANRDAFKTTLEEQIKLHSERTRSVLLDRCERVLAEATASRYQALHNVLFYTAEASAGGGSAAGDTVLKML